MRILQLGNPENYEEAGKLFLEKVDLNSLQLSNLNYFLNNIISRHLPNKIVNKQFEVKFLKWYLDKSILLPDNQCKSQSRNKEIGLRVIAEITVKDVRVGKRVMIPGGTTTVDFMLDKIPILTDKGTFIINGNEVAMVSHLSNATGLTVWDNNGLIVSLDADEKTQISMGLFERKKNSKEKNQLLFTINNSKGPNRGKSQRGGNQAPLTCLIKELGIETTNELYDVIGFYPFMKSIDTEKGLDGNLESMLGDVKITSSNRSNFNLQISFKSRVVKKIVAEELNYFSISEQREKRVDKGTVISQELAEDMQDSGVQKVKIYYSGMVFPVYNNMFVDISKHVDENTIPDEYKIFVRGDKKAVMDYEKVSYVKLKLAMDQAKGDKILLKNLLSSEYRTLTGSMLLKEDLIAMLNYLFSFIQKVEPVESRDSLSNRTLKNIYSVFEDLFIERLYGKKFSLESNIADVIKNAQIQSKSDDVKLNFELNVKDESTISKKICSPPLNKLFQRSANLNPMDEISNKRKISLTKVEGYGGVDPELSMPRARSVHPSHVGRICPIETPEGKTVGLIVNLASTARVDFNGVIEAPFFKVDHETNTIDFTRAIYLSYSEEKNYIRSIAPKIADRDYAKVVLYKSDIQVYEKELEVKIQEVNGKRFIANTAQLEIEAKRIFEEFKDADNYELKKGMKNWFEEDFLDAIDSTGELVRVSSSSVDLISCRGDHILSSVVSNIPFAEYNDGTRSMMGTAQIKQTVPVYGGQVPLVRTEMNKKIGNETDGVLIAPFDAVVTSVSSREVVIKSLDDGTVKTFILEIFRKSSEETSITQKPKVSVGDIVSKGDILADTMSTKEGEIATGVNLLVAYMSWEGYNFEDGIVISSRLFEEDILTSQHIFEYTVEFDPTKDLSMFDYNFKYSSNFHSKYLRNAYKNGEKYSTLKVGTKINTGNTIFVKNVLKKGKSGDKVSDYTQVDVKFDNEPGTIVKVLTPDDGIGNFIKYTILSEEKIKEGDKLSGRHGNKGVVARILNKSLMPYTEDGKIVDIILTPLGIPSRMNIGQLIETSLGLILKESNLKATYRNGSKIDVQKLKMISNMYTGDDTGKIQLFDGRTGRPFNSKTLVGYATINKLKHIASHKMTSRGVGAPDEYTSNGQPTAGKAKNGGQKIGEMEVWAFKADNAVNCLREIQVYRSDDENNRLIYQNALEKSEKKEGDIKANFSQSYKKAITYMRSLGLSMRHYDQNGDEIDIYVDRSELGSSRQSRKVVKNKQNQEKKSDKKENFEIDMNDIMFGDLSVPVVDEKSNDDKYKSKNVSEERIRLARMQFIEESNIKELEEKEKEEEIAKKIEEIVEELAQGDDSDEDSAYADVDGKNEERFKIFEERYQELEDKVVEKLSKLGLNKELSMEEIKSSVEETLSSMSVQDGEEEKDPSKLISIDEEELEDSEEEIDEEFDREVEEILEEIMGSEDYETNSYEDYEYDEEEGDFFSRNTMNDDQIDYEDFDDMYEDGIRQNQMRRKGGNRYED